MRVWVKQMQTVIHRMDKQTPTVAQGTMFNILCQTIMKPGGKRAHTHVYVYITESLCCMELTL